MTTAPPPPRPHGESFWPPSAQAPIEDSEHQRAIVAIDAAIRRVMALYGGNLDHPALRFLEAAQQVVREVERGEEWHEFDCGPVGGGWPHPARAHIESRSCATCGWSGDRRLTTPSRARAGGCDDPWHTVARDTDVGGGLEGW